MTRGIPEEGIPITDIPITDIPKDILNEGIRIEETPMAVTAIAVAGRKGPVARALIAAVRKMNGRVAASPA